jgi:hypothetical protein
MHEVMNLEIAGFFDRKLGPGDTPDKRAQPKPSVLLGPAAERGR